MKLPLLLFIMMCFLYGTVILGSLQNIMKIHKLDSMSQISAYFYISLVLSISITMIALNWGFFFISYEMKIINLPWLVVAWSLLSGFTALMMFLGNTFFESYMIMKINRDIKLNYKSNL